MQGQQALRAGSRPALLHCRPSAAAAPAAARASSAWRRQCRQQQGERGPQLVCRAAAAPAAEASSLDLPPLPPPLTDPRDAKVREGSPLLLRTAVFIVQKGGEGGGAHSLGWALLFDCSTARHSGAVLAALARAAAPAVAFVAHNCALRHHPSLLHPHPNCPPRFTRPCSSLRTLSSRSTTPQSRRCSTWWSAALGPQGWRWQTASRGRGSACSSWTQTPRWVAWIGGVGCGVLI